MSARTWTLVLAAALAFALVAAAASALVLGPRAPGASAPRFGRLGEPVHLVVGYQPYYTESWSGVVMRGRKLYERHLPPGSTVSFEIGLQGAVIVNNMLAGKQHIGYLGDMPAIISTTKVENADLRIVAAIGLGVDQCNVLLTRPDAPPFADAPQALAWLSGKQVAVPKGSCTDRFAQATFDKLGVRPKDYLNQNIEVITSNFRAGKIDGAVIWEPTASRLVEEGLARRVASGASFGETDAGFLVMRADLLEQRPDVAKAFLHAELDAQLFLADERNAAEVIALAKAQTTGFSERALWRSLYGSYEDPARARLRLPFAITEEVREHIDRATRFLYATKGIHVPALRADAVQPELAEQVLRERALAAPIGEVVPVPDARAPER